MQATLITTIGRGSKDSTGTAYRKTSYVIGEWASPQTPFFAQAWLSSPQGKVVDRVELIGTATSSWSALVEEYRSDASGEQLWMDLEEACGEQTSPGVTHADLLPLAGMLSQVWQREVHCHVVCHREVDDHSADQVLHYLLELLPLGDAQRHLYLDTTHGLRSLPLLALSAVQMADAFKPGFAQRTHLIYGEFLGSPRGFTFHAVSRNLAIADACRVWEQSLDAEPLASAISADYPAIAKTLRALSLTLHGNAFGKLDGQLRRLANSLKALEGETRQPWQPLLIDALARFHRHLNQPSLAHRLVALADMRAQRHQYGLAILALAEAATALSCPEPVDSFEAMQEAGRRFSDTLDKKQRQEWKYLFQARNRIAHGANLVEQKGQINEQNLAASYERCLNLLRPLLRGPLP